MVEQHLQIVSLLAKGRKKRMKERELGGTSIGWETSSIYTYACMGSYGSLQILQLMLLHTCTSCPLSGIVNCTCLASSIFTHTCTYSVHIHTLMPDCWCCCLASCIASDTRSTRTSNCASSFACWLKSLRALSRHGTEPAQIYTTWLHDIHVQGARDTVQ